MREAAKTTGEMMVHPSLPPPVTPRSSAISLPGGEQPEYLRCHNPVINHRSESVISKKEVHNYFLQNNLA